ncbi:MAG: helix-turn-helix domain-containing protein [Nanoarchaeota archaeon]
MNIEPLKQAGLTEGEIKVYLALIKLGSSTIGPILDESKITKSIIYRILDKLIDKGLVSYITKQKTKYFQASQPNRLLDYLNKKDKELQENKKKIQDLIPQLLSQQTHTKKSEANIYEGFKGIMTAYENRYQKLKKGDEVILYSLPAEQPGFHHAYWKKHHKLLAKLGIKCRMLYNQEVSNEIIKNRNNYKGCEARKMPYKLKTPSWVMIYKDVTLVAIPQGAMPLAFEITNQEIANSFKDYFETFWKIAKK